MISNKSTKNKHSFKYMTEYDCGKITFMLKLGRSLLGIAKTKRFYKKQSNFRYEY